MTNQMDDILKISAPPFRRPPLSHTFPPPMVPPPLLHVLSFLLLFVSVFSAASAAVPDCTPYRCGDGGNITYPFWHDDGVNSSKSYCGYPLMGLTCKDGSPTLRTDFNNYTVTKIDPSNRTISLLDADVVDTRCTRVRPNLTLEVGLPCRFQYAPSTSSLTFLFNCTRHLPNIPRIPCFREVRNFTSYVLRDWVVADKAYEKNLSDSCRQVVGVPVDRQWVEQFGQNISKEFGRALLQGFRLQWKKRELKSCNECEGSGGSCGLRNGDIVCYCKDGSHKDGSCDDDGHKKNVIAIGVSVAAFFVVCVGAILWWCRKHKKDVKKESSGRSPLVRSISSDPPALSKDTQYQSNNHLAHIFTYKELDDATNGFHPSNELGDGGFGTVYKGEIRDGRTVAVKRLYGNNYKRMEQFMNEILILNKIRHPNLVTLYGCTSRQSRELLLVYEYVANGTVADHLHGSRAEEKSLTWPMRMRIAVETASALAYLHATEPQIVHRDVKTHNILLDKDFHVKVADFGLSRLFPTDVSHVSTAPQGTPGYVDPEYHQCYQLTDKSDVYSFGVVLVELVSSKPAVDITRSRSEINLSNMATSRIRDGLLHELADPDLGFESDPDVTRMIRSVAELAFLCLQAEKDLRPCMEEVKNELMRTAGGGKELDEVYVDVDKNAEDDAYLLRHSGSCSPNTVMAQWKSRSTTPNTSA